MQIDSDTLLCRQIVERSQDAVIFSDREGLIRLWNSGADRTVGYLAEEALGRTLDIIIPAQLRERHWEGYRKVMSIGRSRYESGLLAVPAIRKDRSRISVEFTLVLIYDERGQMDGIAAIIRDVTERWNQEKATEQRLAQLENHCQSK